MISAYWGFSIDDNFRNQGYGSNALNGIFEFIDSTLKLEINHIILAVNEKNILAQKAYRNSGFFVVKKDLEGKRGKLIIYGEKQKTSIITSFCFSLSL